VTSLELKNLFISLTLCAEYVSGSRCHGFLAFRILDCEVCFTLNYALLTPALSHSHALVLVGFVSYPLITDSSSCRGVGARSWGAVRSRDWGKYTNVRTLDRMLDYGPLQCMGGEWVGLIKTISAACLEFNIVLSM
jgi:hypothetical protein